MIIKRNRVRPLKRKWQKAVNSPSPKVSVIIPAMNEAKTIAGVIHHASRVHHESETIVVVNGSTDRTEAIARRMGARVIVFPEALGHDVARSIGATYAEGDILLFTDSDMILQTKDLLPFIQAVQNGVDVALNKYLGPIWKKNVHPVVLAKHVMNLALHRSDLRGVSMTTVPHAVHRHVLDMIDPIHLSVPPLAHAMALENGLNVQAVHYVNVGIKNPRKRKGWRDPLLDLIVGDHLEALAWMLQQNTDRGQYADQIRDREAVR